jgi:hypothetical protein
LPPIHIGGHKDFLPPSGGNLPQRLTAQASLKLFQFFIYHSAFFISS